MFLNTQTICLIFTTFIEYVCLHTEVIYLLHKSRIYLSNMSNENAILLKQTGGSVTFLN